jgi:hypothetical protein
MVCLEGRIEQQGMYSHPTDLESAISIGAKVIHSSRSNRLAHGKSAVLITVQPAIFHGNAASVHIVEVLVGKVTGRPNVNVQLGDAPARCRLDLILLVVGKLDRQFVPCQGVASCWFSR